MVHTEDAGHPESQGIGECPIAEYSSVLRFQRLPRGLGRRWRPGRPLLCCPILCCPMLPLLGNCSPGALSVRSALGPHCRAGFGPALETRTSSAVLCCLVPSRAALAGRRQPLEPSLCGPLWVPAAGRGLGWRLGTRCPPGCRRSTVQPCPKSILPRLRGDDTEDLHRRTRLCGFLRERCCPLWDPQALLPGDSPFFTEVSRCVSQILNPNTPHPPSPSSLAPPRAGDKFLKFQLPAHIPKHQLPLSTLSTICCPCYI
jgi:hypothetical protein